MNEAAQIITAGETGIATIGVSGYNGASSSSQYVLRVKITPPPPIPATCPARPLIVTAANQGALPASIPATTKSLFIVDKQRLMAMYGAYACGRHRDHVDAERARNARRAARGRRDDPVRRRQPGGARRVRGVGWEAVRQLARE